MLENKKLNLIYALLSACKNIILKSQITGETSWGVELQGPLQAILGMQKASSKNIVQDFLYMYTMTLIKAMIDLL